MRDRRAFDGRVLVLTGASGGIGRAIARRFHADGAALILSDVDGPALEAFARSLDPGGNAVAAIEADDANPADADRVVTLARERFGGVDFLVFAAGIYLAQPIRQMSDTQWRQTLSVNLDGVFYLTQRTIDLLRADSAIVTLTSMAAHRGSYSHAHYGASKGGVLSLTRALARELGPQTRVNAVSPGIIETPMANDLIAKRGEESIAQTPLGRLGHPDEVASVVHFLSGDAASFITGEVIHVNGGLYIAG